MAFSDGRYDNYRNEICFRNVASPTVLYPRELHYFYECDKKSVPEEVAKKLDAVIGYMSKRNMLCDVHFTVLCPQADDVGKKTEEQLNALKDKAAEKMAQLKEQFEQAAAVQERPVALHRDHILRRFVPG